MKKNILPQTASHTVGPFFGYGLTAEQYNYDFPSIIKPNMRKEGINGIPICLTGKVLDGDNNPLNDAMIEIWHADPDGKYGTKTKSGVFGFGRCGTGSNKEGAYQFKTYKPGSSNDSDPPYVNMIIFARGIQNHLFTRVYFPEDKNLFANDSLLQQIDSSKHKRLTARSTDEGSYAFDIVLQGDNESVFLDI